MMNSAQGYDVMMWVDEVLPKETVILSTHRSLALSPRKAIAFDWYKHVANDQHGLETYLSLLFVKKPEYFLLRSEYKLKDGKPPDIKFKIPCIGQVYAGPFTAKNTN